MSLLARKEPSVSALQVIRACALVCIGVLTQFSYAMEIVYARPEDHKNYTHNYNMAVLKLALKSTVSEFGPYRIRYTERHISTGRVFQELKLPKGRVSVHATLTSIEREAASVAIPIPIRKGLLSYRLMIINDATLERFVNISSEPQLLHLNAGLAAGWVITKIFKAKSANITEAYSVLTGFKMLSRGRFDYLSRGVNEVFDDFQNNMPGIDNLMIHPELAIHLPTVYYFFVRRDHPVLVQRITKGMENIIANGQLDELFYDYYGAAISRAKLKDRNIIKLDNPLLPDSVPLSRHELWYSPSEK